MYRRRGSLRIRRLHLGPGASARASAVRLGWTVQAQRPWALWLMPYLESDDAASFQPSAAGGIALEVCWMRRENGDGSNVVDSCWDDGDEERGRDG